MDPADVCDFFGGEGGGLGSINHIFWGIFKMMFNQMHNGIQCGENNNTTVSTQAVQILFLIV